MFALDAAIRRATGLHALHESPNCLFRVSLKPSPCHYSFADGTQVCRGDLVVELHLWNEHIPPMPDTGPDVAWASAFYRRLRWSLRLLARYMATSPDARAAKAAYGRLFLSLNQRDPATLMLRRLGFEFRPVPKPVSCRGRVGRFFVTLYAGWLVWAYNPGSLKAASIWAKDLVEVWISRATLLGMLHSSPREHELGEDGR